MDYRITHTTEYAYQSPAPLGYSRAYLTPRETPWQSCRFHRIVVSPQPATMTRRVDSFGNHEALWTLQERHQQLRITASSRVSVHSRPRIALEDSPPWEEIVRLVRSDPSPSVLEAYEQAFDSPLVRACEEAREFAAPDFPPGRPILEAVRALTARIHGRFDYDNTQTTSQTSPEEALRLRAGVCQDFAHVAIACLRSLGLPARYASGYLRTIPPPGQERLVGADASHAWFAAYAGPLFGWVDFDPTNDCIPDTDHVLLAWGRDYGDVSPVRGVVLGGGPQSLSVSVDVAPVDP